MLLFFRFGSPTYYHCSFFLECVFSSTLSGKESPLVQKIWVRSLGQEDPLEGGHGNPFQHSCLKNPTDRRAGQTVVHKVTKSGTRLKRLAAHTRLLSERLASLRDSFQRAFPAVTFPVPQVEQFLLWANTALLTLWELALKSLSPPLDCELLMRAVNLCAPQLLSTTWLMLVAQCCGRENFDLMLCGFLTVPGFTEFSIRNVSDKRSLGKPWLTEGWARAYGFSWTQASSGE